MNGGRLGGRGERCRDGGRGGVLRLRFFRSRCLLLGIRELRGTSTLDLGKRGDGGGG